jgi:hypothetical protein
VAESSIRYARCAGSNVVGVHRSSTARHMQADVDGERGGKVRLAIRLECRRTREDVEAELAYEAIWSKWVTQS